MEQVRDRAQVALESVRETAETVRDRADAVLAEIEKTTKPASRRRRPVAVAFLAAGVTAAALTARKLLRGAAEEGPVPSPPGMASTPATPAEPEEPAGAGAPSQPSGEAAAGNEKEAERS